MFILPDKVIIKRFFGVKLTDKNENNWNEDINNFNRKKRKDNIIGFYF